MSLMISTRVTTTTKVGVRRVARVSGSSRFRVRARVGVGDEIVILLGEVVVVEVVVDVKEVVSVTLQIRPNDPPNIPAFFAVVVYHLPQRVCANDDAE